MPVSLHLEIKTEVTELHLKPPTRPRTSVLAGVAGTVAFEGGELQISTDLHFCHNPVNQADLRF